VIQITGHHYHNDENGNKIVQFVRNTLLKNLKEREIDLPHGRFTMKELGVDYPVIVSKGTKLTDEVLTDENVEVMPTAGMENPMSSGGFGNRTPPGAAKTPPAGKTDPAKVPERQRDFPVKRFNFILQFCWKPTTISERLLKRKQQEEAEKAAKAQAELAANPMQ
jgi:type IV pilus assembly protein PilM